MKQVARNLTDPVDGFLRDAQYLNHDRDPPFTEAFTAILGSRGVKSVKLPAKSPNCNPHAERFVRTIKYECLNNFVFFGEWHLRYVVKEFVDHYQTERFHQGIGGQLIKGQSVSANDNGTTDQIAGRSRLGSLLNYYSSGGRVSPASAASSFRTLRGYDSIRGAKLRQHIPLTGGDRAKARRRDHQERGESWTEGTESVGICDRHRSRSARSKSGAIA